MHTKSRWGKPACAGLVFVLVTCFASYALAAWSAMSNKAICNAMSIVDANVGYLLHSPNTGGFKLYSLKGGAWDAGVKVTIGSLLLTGDVAAMHFIDANVGYIVPSAGGVIYKTTDGGKTWNAVAITGVGTTGFGLKKIDFGSKTHGVVYGRLNNKNFLATTTDGGDNWKAVSVPAGSGLGIADVAMAGAGMIVAVGQQPVAKGAIFTSTDGGTSWTKRDVLSKGVVAVSFITDQIGFAVSHPPKGVAAINEVFLRTTDGGKTWVSPTTGVLPVTPVSLAFVDKDNGYIAGAKIARTTDGGKIWTIEARPVGEEYKQAGDGITCLSYPGPAAYAGTFSGKGRMLKNDSAGGSRPARYGNTTPTPDAGAPLPDASAPTSDAGTSTSDAGASDAAASNDANPTADAGGGGGGGGGGGCAVAGQSGGLGLLLFMVCMALLGQRRRRRQAGSRVGTQAVSSGT